MLVSEWVEDALFEIISVFIEVNRTVVDTEVFHVDFIEGNRLNKKV